MIQIRMSQSLTQASVVLLLGVASFSAQASLVTEWDYSTSAFFSDPSWTDGNGVTKETSSELSWGSGSYCRGGFLACLLGFGTTVFPDFENPTSNSSRNRSALTIGSGPDSTLTGGGPAIGTASTVMDGSLDTGDYALGTNITHWNNPISGTFGGWLGGFSLLESATLTNTLTLTPVMTEDGAVSGQDGVDAPTIEFSFDFLETLNTGTCAGGEPGPCPDLFGFDEMPLLDLEFDYQDVTYFVSVLMTNETGSASPINPLHDEECGALGLEPGCQGFRTIEEQATTAQFAFSIAADPLFTEDEPFIDDDSFQNTDDTLLNQVPAPTPLALVGLGLLAMGMSRQWARTAR